jgi:hypothetical protein
MLSIAYHIRNTENSTVYRDIQLARNGLGASTENDITTAIPHYSRAVVHNENFEHFADMVNDLDKILAGEPCNFEPTPPEPKSEVDTIIEDYVKIIEKNESIPDSEFETQPEESYNMHGRGRAESIIGAIIIAILFTLTITLMIW